jgi:hypothetical protein
LLLIIISVLLLNHPLFFSTNYFLFFSSFLFCFISHACFLYFSFLLLSFHSNLYFYTSTSHAYLSFPISHSSSRFKSTYCSLSFFLPLLFLLIPFFSSTCQFLASFPFLLRLQRLNYFLSSQQAWTMRVRNTEPSSIWQLIRPPYWHGWFSENKSLDWQAMKVSQCSSLPSFRERIYVNLLILPDMSTYADIKLRSTVSVVFTPTRECIKFTDTSVWTYVTETNFCDLDRR